MKCAIAKEHRDFFQKQGWIEFEELLSDSQLVLAQQAIERILAERVKVGPERLPSFPATPLYLHGRDLWRSHPSLFPSAAHIRFVQVASDLLEKKPLRLGYDQFLPACPDEAPFAETESQIYTRFLMQTADLTTVSCLEGIACGVMLALDNEDSALPNETPPEALDVFSKQRGHVIFFRPDAPVQWNRLYAHPGCRFYLIVYTQASAHYRLQPSDPHTHALKRLGYVFNDKLNDRLHPIIYR